MKLKLIHLFSLLFALSTIVVSCDKSNPADGDGYLFNEELSVATRLSSAENNLPENCFYLNFSNSTGDRSVSVMLVGGEGETVLQSGTYTASANNLLMDECVVSSGKDVYQCKDGDGTVTVTGDVDDYSFDIELSDGNRTFHFTYSGAVDGMVVTEPVLPDNNIYFTASSFTGIHMSNMGNMESYIIAFTDESQDGDGNKIPATVYYQCAFYNGLGEVDSEGYVTVPSGTYTISKNAAEFTIANFSSYMSLADSKSIKFEDATAVVTETQTVLTAVIDSVTHVVTYNGPLRMKADLPDPPIVFEASCAYAYYSADVFGDGEVDVFKLYLSDLGLDDDGQEQADGTYYQFTLHVDGLDPEAEVAIPAGRYEITASSTVPGSASGGYYYVLDENADDIVKSGTPTSGYIIINEDGSVEAECTMIVSGAVHSITYSGEIEILKNTIPSESPYSTLTEDKECVFPDHGYLYMDKGDSYGTGYQTWSFTLSGNHGKGDAVAFELLGGECGKSDIFGRYTVSDSMGEYTALPGGVEGFTLINSWYYYRKNMANITEYAPIVAGWIEISENNDGTLSVEFDLYDDLNNNITGSWTSND